MTVTLTMWPRPALTEQGLVSCVLSTEHPRAPERSLSIHCVPSLSPHCPAEVLDDVRPRAGAVPPVTEEGGADRWGGLCGLRPRAP